MFQLSGARPHVRDADMTPQSVLASPAQPLLTVSQYEVMTVRLWGSVHRNSKTDVGL